MEHHIRHMKENDRAIQEKMANSCSMMARERERMSAEKLARIVAEEERIAEQEENKRRHEQQLHAQRTQEQKDRLAREMEEYERMKEKEELMKMMMAQRDQFMIKYYDFVALTKACKDKHAVEVLLMTNASKIKEFSQQFQVIDNKIRVIIEKILSRKC